MHAAARHEVSVLGITLSPAQAELARRRVAERGLSDRIEIRLADYRELRDEPFDAVASIGMAEHVGSNQIDAYAETLAGMVRPGGRVLNHAIARLRHGEPEAGPFSERFVFPDAAPLHLSRVQHALERAGLVTDHVEGFPADYATTLGHWARRLDANLDAAAPARRRGARARVAPLPTRGAARLRERVHGRLSGAGPPALTRSRRSTVRATSARDDTPSLRNRLRTWLSTVLRLTKSWPAISRLVRRSTSSRATSSSRSLSDSSPAASALPRREGRWTWCPSLRSSRSAASR